MKEAIKTPWYKYYDGVREHLEYPDCSIYQLLKESAQKHLNLTSYNYYGNKKTFKEFIKEIDTCALALVAQGVKEKDVVSICMPNTPEGVIAFYAINKIGAIANMIHPLSAENEIKKYVNDTKSRVLIVIDIALGKIDKIKQETGLEKIIYVSPADSMPLILKAGYKMTKQKSVKNVNKDEYISWKHFISEGVQASTDIKSASRFAENADNENKTDDKPVKRNQDNCPDDIAAILYSGGTSGFPKGIALTNRNFNALAMQGLEACATIGEGDSVLAIMPIFHGFGLGICIHTTQYMGGCSILLPTFSAATFDELLRKYKPNIIAGVPTLYEAMLKNKKLDGVDLSFLKCVISGGDSLSVSLKGKIDEFLKSHGADIQVREGYGLTECVTGSCLMPPKVYREGSIGIPYPDVYYKIVKPNTSEEVEYGQEGEIVLCGPTVMKEYLYHEEETRQTLRKHPDGALWLHTGDLGYMDEDGFIYFRQRLKRVIMSSGYCVYPQYIENILDSHPAVLMSCVIGVDHPYKVQVAKAFIVLKNGYTQTSELKKSLKKLCEENLAKYSWPVAYEFRDELPKTLVGKIAYTKLEEEEHKAGEK